MVDREAEYRNEGASPLFCDLFLATYVTSQTSQSHSCQNGAISSIISLQNMSQWAAFYI